MNLELLLLAHLALDRTCLKGREKPRVSAACRRVVRLLRTMPTSVPFDVDSVLAYAEYQHTEPSGLERAFDLPLDRLPAPLPDVRALEILELVEPAAALSAADLSLLSRETVLSCLGAVVKPSRTKSKVDRILEIHTSTAEAPAA